MALKISFKAEAQTEKNGEGVTHKLYIYDPVHGGYDIDPESWEFHTSETSAAYFRKALEAVSKSDTIEVHINSAGGSVKEGLAIANQLAAHPARKVAYVDGCTTRGTAWRAMPHSFAARRMRWTPSTPHSAPQSCVTRGSA